ncbi:hypothetical protein TWF694_008295 [Orbilia ellipsospora]|uniref:Uncharacterized protein n=1 Tax=Orbilia ellipsospora TaxID=2528407 RepID=A0AAV9XGW0_9PEZI
MQTEDGYAIKSQVQDGGFVIGHNDNTFPLRVPAFVPLDALENLRTGGRTAPPWGQIYRSPNATVNFNVTETNKMPLDASKPIFLTMQAETPIIAKKAFGMLDRYNCSIVNSIDQFTILNRRRNDPADFRSMGKIYPVGSSLMGSTIMVLQYSENRSRLTRNIQSGGYSNNSYNSPGIDNPTILEIALWQSFSIAYMTTMPDKVASRDVENDIPELRGLYPENLDDSNDDGLWPDGKAIGCRCFAGSDLGYADIDGRSASYSNFTLVKRVGVNITDPEYTSFLKRFEIGAISVLVSSNSETLVSRSGITFDRGWYLALWRATGLIRKYTQTVSDFSTYVTSPIQAEDLRETILRIYTTYALELMYDATSGPGDAVAWFNPNITIASKAKVLHRGIVPLRWCLVCLPRGPLGS